MTVARAPVVAQLVDTLFPDDGEKVPGAFKYWTRAGGPDPSGMHFWCPCGCEALLGVEFPRWKWDGNREKPTVTPSILHSTPGGCGWHGFLTNGKFVSC